MHQTPLNQELARVRYAEALREATRRHALLRDEPPAEPRSRRIRLLRRFGFRPALGS